MVLHVHACLVHHDRWLDWLNVILFSYLKSCLLRYIHVDLSKKACPFQTLQASIFLFPLQSVASALVFCYSYTCKCTIPPPPPPPHTHTGGCLCCPSSGNKYSQLSNSETTPSQKPYDRVAATVCIFLFFVILFVFAVFETLGSPLTMDEFAWTKKEAILYNNLFYVGLAFLAVFTFIAVKFITKK